MHSLLTAREESLEVVDEVLRVEVGGKVTGAGAQLKTKSKQTDAAKYFSSYRKRMVMRWWRYSCQIVRMTRSAVMRVKSNAK